MKAINNFTSIETTNEGFKRLKMLTEERNNWNNAAQRYEDGFYRNWLLLRMEDWPKLEFERNIIIGTPDMTFATAKARVLTVIKSIQDKLYMTQSRQYTNAPDRNNVSEPNISMDSISLNYQGSAVQQPILQGQNYKPRQAIHSNNKMLKCFNCGIQGHVLSQC